MNFIYRMKWRRMFKECKMEEKKAMRVPYERCDTKEQFEETILNLYKRYWTNIKFKIDKFLEVGHFLGFDVSSFVESAALDLGVACACMEIFDYKNDKTSIELSIEGLHQRIYDVLEITVKMHRRVEYVRD